MNHRNENARIIQGGASNRRVIASKLFDAIVDCNNEGVSTETDPAVFLILHQLVWVITGHDISVGDERLAKRWEEATKAVQA